MSELKFTVAVSTSDEEQAEQVRGAITGTLRNLSHFGWPGFDIRVGHPMVTGFMPAIEEARKQYAERCDDNIEIPDDASVSPAEDGYWVQAYVYVRKDNIN